MATTRERQKLGDEGSVGAFLSRAAVSGALVEAQQSLEDYYQHVSTAGSLV